MRKERDYVFAPTDKTGKWSPMLTTVYEDKLLNHIANGCVEIDKGKLELVHTEAHDILKKCRGLMSAGEAKYIERWIDSRQLPTSRLLIKDHKKCGADGEFPTRLLIPATNFTQCYAKMGYKIIKNLFDKNRVSYEHYPFGVLGSYSYNF